MKMTEEQVVEVPSKFYHEVDIIVPFYGQYNKVTTLVESIFRFTRSNYYNLHLVDDHSPNESFIKKVANNARKRNVTNFKAMRCETQKGFGGACQAAFDRSTAPFVCFVNSDCCVEDLSWLRAMGECLLSLREEGVRMVSAKTNNPVEGDPAQEGKKGVVVDDFVLSPKSHLSFYCFMCHRDLFSQCGGFLKNYPFGGYEDTEFAYRMSKRGYKQAVAGKSWIYHEGEASIKFLWQKNPRAKKVMTEDNYNQCLADIGLKN